MKNTKTILTILLSFYFLTGKSQKEFLATVNPSTGIHSIIDSIPGVNYIFQNATAFDKNNHRYMFLGKDFGGQNHLYSVNALSGALISSPICTLNAGELQYDNVGNKLYALEINNPIGKMFVVSLNLNTGTSTIIDTLPFTGYSGGTTFFNEASHSYVVQNFTSMHSMNVNTGSLSSTSFATGFISLCYDNVGGFAYGITGGASMSVVKINMSNATYSAVGSFTFSGTSTTHKTLDEINQRYTFSSSNHLYSISLNTGSVVSGPVFPQGLTGVQNVIELHYDNSNGKLYALHWGSLTATAISDLTEKNSDDFKIMPNPTAGSTISVYLGRQVQNINTTIYNALGEVVFKGTDQNVKSTTIQLNNTPKGVYFISVEAEDKRLGIKKIIVE
jgi:Secretion system C-terminal sorting domain